MLIRDILRLAIELPDQTCEAYGDESIGGDVVVYALAVSLSEHVGIAEDFIARKKWAHSVDESARIHCRELFSGDLRKKGPWSRLSLGDVLTLCKEIVIGLRSIGICFVIVVAVKSAFPKAFKMQPPFPDIALREKQLALVCANASVMPLLSWFGHERFNFWPDPDVTRVDWLGQHRKIITTPGFFTDFGGVGDQVVHGVVAGNKPALLEAADVVAYAAQRALSRERSQLRKSFRGIYSLCEAARVECTIAPAGALALHFPDGYRAR
jgi:hypothetical protein